MNIDAEIERARTLHRQGKIGDAVAVYQEVLKSRPDHPQAVHLLGVAALQTGKPADAAILLERAVSLLPNDPWPGNNLGAALLQLDRPAEAEACFRQSVAIDPGYFDGWFNLGNSLRTQKKLQEAIEAYRKALRIRPDHPSATNNLAAAYQMGGNMDAALELYRAAVRVAPGLPEPLSNLVAALELTNHLDEAQAAAVELARVAPDAPVAQLMRARTARRAGNLEHATALVDSAIAANPAPGALFPIHHEKALLLDLLGDPAGAFAALARSKHVRQTLPDAQSRNLDAYPDYLAQGARWFTRERLEAAPAPPADDRRGLVFFVGFPRSGTTLMEQILGAHPAMVTTAESSPLEKILLNADSVLGRKVALPDDFSDLGAADIAALRDRFFRIAEDVTGDDLTRKILVDKMPLNLPKLGHANWLFSNSKAIVALRDPRDVVLSCYMQQFHLNAAMHQFLDLERAARFYALVMDIWLECRGFLTMPWIEYRYEDLVADFDGTVRKVLAFIGVEWDSSVDRYAEKAMAQHIRTPSYAAVTQPISNRAVARWRIYREQLAPVLPILAPYVKEFGYDAE